ncbi:hypothetical protein BsWGS_01768 [Bradybaena similaris]
MATLNVCSRLFSKVDRFKVSVPGLEDVVKTLALEISKHLNSKETEFDIIYAGQVLKSNKSLSSYCLQHQSTVYVVHKFSSADGEDESHKVEDYADAAGSTSKSDVFMAIKSALLVDDYKKIVGKMLNDPETVESIIAATPGLDKDPCVLAMLQDPELLAVLAHPNNIDSLLRLHPSFAQAAATIASAVTEEGAKAGQKSGAGNQTYSMDQMSDEDEEDDEITQAARMRRNVAGQSITASQLAIALQAATASGRVPGSPQSSAAIPSTSQMAPSASSSGTITSDFFQQAMAHAQSASSDAALQQLREMGITDENVARQALAATGGDIQLAIDLIFGDGFNM